MPFVDLAGVAGGTIELEDAAGIRNVNTTPQIIRVSVLRVVFGINWKFYMETTSIPPFFNSGSIYGKHHDEPHFGGLQIDSQRRSDASVP